MTQRVTPCTSCSASIVFLRTSTGKVMPVDAATVLPEDDVFDPKRHKSHFASCPNSAQHRRPR